MKSSSEKKFDLSAKGILAYGLMLAVVIEVITLAMRFGIGWQSTRDTQWLSPFTLGFRIHHGYFGVALIILTLSLYWLLAKRICTHKARPRKWLSLFYMVGIGLVFSDLVHHFLVIWPTTGSPQFDLIY